MKAPPPLLVPLVAASLAAANPATGNPAGPQARRDYATLDVCRLVPGDSIAQAVGGKLVEARPFASRTSSRCTYFVALPVGSQRAAYVVWIQPPEDFEGLKQYIEEPLTVVPGLGDGAYLFRDKGDGRFKLHVMKRGDLMFEATADTAEGARRVADAVVSRLWKKAP